MSGPAPELLVVVPTLGRSPLLAACLAALRADRGPGLAVVVVHQGEASLALPAGAAEEVVRVPRPLGFAAATNLGAARAHGDWLATVNDDVVVAPGWSAALLAALDADPGAAAAQGVNLRDDRPDLADGCGLAWNRAWQAVQIGHGEPAPPAGDPRREIFGVSATAAVYRRSALAAAAPPVGPFDTALGSYYEDVDLACRLRARGHHALLVPAARARHAGGATGGRLGARRWRWLYGNRLLVLARLLGARFWHELPRLAGRDLRDGAGALVRADLGRALAIPAGWARAASRLPRFARTGPPLVAPDELRRFGAPT